MFAFLSHLRNYGLSLSVQFSCSGVCAWTAALQASLPITTYQNLLKLMFPAHHHLPEPTQTHVPCPSPTTRTYSNSCPWSWWCHPTISPSVVPFSSRLQSLPALASFPVSLVFASGGQSIGSFSSTISLSGEYPGLISFRIDWFDPLAVQGTFKSLLQHHSSKASILQHSAFFVVQLSHPYVTTRKTVALTRWTFVGKVMSLVFNMLSRLVIAFLPRSVF